MKFKTMEIKDASIRQVTMQEDSDKETVLFAEQFKAIENKNNEFVIGLPLEVRMWSLDEITELAKKIRIFFNEYYKGEDFAVAIHSKKLEDEVHFHISYNHEALNPELIEIEFLKFKI